MLSAASLEGFDSMIAEYHPVPSTSAPEAAGTSAQRDVENQGVVDADEPICSAFAATYAHWIVSSAAFAHACCDWVQIS